MAIFTELNSLEHQKFLSYHILLQFYAGFLLLSVYLPLSSSLLLAIAVDWQYINTFLCPACGWLALFSHHLLPRLARLVLGCCRRRWRHPQLRCYIRAGQDTASSYTAQHRAMWHKLAHHWFQFEARVVVVVVLEGGAVVGQLSALNVMWQQRPLHAASCPCPCRVRALSVSATWCCRWCWEWWWWWWRWWWSTKAAVAAAADNDYWSCGSDFRTHANNSVPPSLSLHPSLCPALYIYTYIYDICVWFGPAEKFQRIKISWLLPPPRSSFFALFLCSFPCAAVVDTVSKMDFRFPVSVCRSSLLFSMLRHTHTQQQPDICM